MAFTIPNHADAASAFQAEPDSVDFDILAAGYSGSGVISGCAVTAQGTPNMTVAVATGVISVAGVRVSVTGANSTIGTADGTNPRFDMITVNNSGTIATTAGTAASVPELPSIPSNSVVLALIFVPASDTTIATNQITDKRVFISNGGSGVLDNIIWNFGSDADAAIVLSSAIIAADDELTNVIEGTSDHLATTANSLIISNVTNDGDILFVVSDGGNSKGLLHLDGANGRVIIHGGDLLMSGAQKIYFFDVGGEYMSSDGSTLTITGATALTPTVGSTAWANANHTHAGSSTGGTIALSAATGTLAVGAGGTGATSLTDGGVLLGSGSSAVTAMTALADGEMIVGDGSTDPVAESGATLRTSIGVGTGDSPQFTGIELSHATANTLTASSGVLSIEGNAVYMAGGTDVAVADGGTNLSSYSAGDVIYASGTTTLAKLSKPGSPAGEVLTFASGASAPSWAASTGGGGIPNAFFFA